MPSFKPRQYIIEAITSGTALGLISRDRVMGGLKSWKSLPEWFSGAIEYGDINPLAYGFRIKTEGGTRFARANDYIVYNNQGELQVISKKEFEETFEEVVYEV